MNPEIDIKTYLEGFGRLFPQLANELPWNIVSNILPTIVERLKMLNADFIINNDVAIHKTARLEDHAIIKGPAIISENCFIAAHTYLRGGVFIAGNCTIGPGTEIKSSILLEKTALAHFNFVGDSIIGSNVNMEAGSMIANHFNERKDKTIFVLLDGIRYTISKNKFGALVGDGTRIGANAVLSPGTILGKNSIVKRLELIEQC
jgi:NDP-sugar pyrophosphorylase family protein